MIYGWCTALTLWLTCTAWLLIDARHRLDAAEREIAAMRIQVQVLRSRINYGKARMPNMTGVTRTE